MGNNNKWICETLGNMEENAVKEFDTKEEAIAEMERFRREINEDYCNPEVILESESSFEVGDGYKEQYQACFVYEKPCTLKEEFLAEVIRLNYLANQSRFEDCNGIDTSNLERLIQKI